MKKTFIMILGGLSLHCAYAQSYVYQAGRTIADQGISVRSWGSGTAAETDETAYEGTSSIRIVTRNYFQGGIIDFGRPVDLSPAFQDANNLLRLTYKVIEVNPTGTPGRPTTQPGRPGFPGTGRPGFPGTGAPGGNTGEEDPSTQQPTTQQPNASAIPAVQQFRYIITTTDGKRSEAYLNLPRGGGERGWRNVAIPLRAIKGFDQTNKQIKNIWVSANTTAVFYVGEMRIINDATPIHGEANVQKLNLAQGDEVRLTATGNGGASILKYTWDFDEKDGIQIDAEGQAIRRKFRKPGTYIITLTVSDQYGLKAPYKTTVTAVVNP